MADSIATLETAMQDNADWLASNSVSKAKLFHTAATQWLILKPLSASHAGSTATMNAAQVERLKQSAEAFILANDNTSRNRSNVRFLGVDIGFGR